MRTRLLTALGAVLSSALAAQDDAPAKAAPPHPARTALEVALAKAGADHQRVLVVATAEATADAAFQTLASKDRTLSRYLLYEFQRVDLPAEAVAGDPRFAPLAAAQGTDLIVVDPQAKVLGRTALAPMLAEEKAGAAIKAWLEPFQAPPVDATEILAEALGKARATDRRVLVRLGAPW